MPKSNRTTSRKPKLDKSISIVDVAVSGVFDLGGSFKPRTEQHKVLLNSTMQVCWEYDTDRGNEFFIATFNSAQLFKAAAELGLLTTTTSGHEKVPKGIATVQKLMAQA